MAGNLSNHEKPKKPKIVRKTKVRGAKDRIASLSKVAAEKNDPGNQRPGLLLFTLIVLYKNLYILGITIVRRFRRYIKRFLRLSARVKGETYSGLERFSLFLLAFRKEFVRKIKLPFARIGNVHDQLRPHILKAKSEGKIPMSAYLQVAYAAWRLIWTVLRTIFNHVAPLAAVWMLLYTINLYLDQPLGLRVIYNNENIGYIQSEADFEKATRILRERFIYESDASPVLGIPSFVLVAMEDEEHQNVQWLANKLMRIETVNEKFTKTEDLADRMVESSGNNIELAYGFYVDNQFYGAVTQRDYITGELEKIREENRIGYRDERVDFVKKIMLKPGLYPVESIVPTEEIDSVIYSNEIQEQVYVVQDNDTPTGIADKTGVPYALLRLMNPTIEESLPIGEEIKTEVARPFLSVKNSYTTVYNEEYDFAVEEIETSTFDKNYREVTQEGENGLQEVTAEITKINGIETDRVTLETRVIKEAVPKKVIVGTNDPVRAPVTTPSNQPNSAAAGSGLFIWPTTGGYTTTYAGHPGNGVDIARPYGTPIYAAAAGTVVKVVYGVTGYGQHIMIDHGNGYQTLYAHCSSLNVSVGQTVVQGQVIGGIGRTGRATGNHVHFEIIQNGRYMYPVNYIGNRG